MFARLDDKHNHKYWEILRKFSKFLMKINRKIEFLISFGNFLTKTRVFGNNYIFLLDFFGFGMISPYPHGYAPDLK